MKHHKVLISCDRLVNELLASMDDRQIADKLGLELRTDSDGIEWVTVEPCWFLCDWPEHVITARFDSDMIAHRFYDDASEMSSDEFNELCSSDYLIARKQRQLAAHHRE